MRNGGRGEVNAETLALLSVTLLSSIQTIQCLVGVKSPTQRHVIARPQRMFHCMTPLVLMQLSLSSIMLKFQ